MARFRRETLKRDWFEKVALVRNDQTDATTGDDEHPVPSAITERRLDTPRQPRASA